MTDIGDKDLTTDGIEGLFALADAHREVLEQLRAVRAAYSHLENEYRSLRQMVAHEVVNPLTAVIGSLDLVVSNTVTEPEHVETLVGRAHAQSQQLGELIEDLLRLPGPTGEQPRAEQARINVARLMADVAVAVRHHIDPDRFLMEVDEGLMMVTSPPRLRRIVTNLVVNASKHGGEDAPIRVTAVRGDGFVDIAVADRGPGIDADLAERIFEPFERGSAAPGLGLGLYVVYTLTRSLGGEISLAPRDGGGTVATVRLPQKRSADVSPATEAASAAPARPTCDVAPTFSLPLS